MRSRIKNIVKNLLLIFVFISIGFALGKRSVPHAENGQKSETGTELVHVYYMHATFRCVTCNTIEKMTKELLESKFAGKIRDKKIIFSEVNFQENEKLAKEFDIVSSCVVVAKERDGNILSYKRLDDVWTLMGKPAEFNDYLIKAIEPFLTRQEDSQ
ncbi:MAG: hypothetical protein A2020_10285 [Lentisphaerae bacterium GWF2_45_14]|nr:MAG: hypothetical protein A2020_10285 [Lentisphaerae bacterium GWF2_45_14]